MVKFIPENDLTIDFMVDYSITISKTAVLLISLSVKLQDSTMSTISIRKLVLKNTQTSIVVETVMNVTWKKLDTIWL